MGMGVTGGAARYSDYADAANYVYTIYVKNSDLARAKAPGALSAEAARRFVPRGFSLALCVPLWDRSYTRRHGEWLGKGKCRPSGGIFD